MDKEEEKKDGGGQQATGERSICVFKMETVK